MSRDARLPNVPADTLYRLREMTDAERRFTELADLLLYRNPQLAPNLDPYGGPHDSFTEPQRHLAALVTLNGRIMDGGMLTFFGDSPGWVAHVSPALQAIGVPELDEAFDRAVDSLAGERAIRFDRTTGAVEEAFFDDRDDDFEWFDDLYFGESDRPNLPWNGLVAQVFERAAAYVFTHLDGFMQHPPRSTLGAGEGD